ncbi:MAG TPA: NAD(P)-binding domain-containing protein [Acidimicrobiia bacterium]|nr:NAD(P)-binding domain-containing protein [Acidimicrobiia bacterium]
MRIGVLGTGMVGRTLAARLAGLGHQVMVGTRDPASTLANTEEDRMGNLPFSRWIAEQQGITLGTLNEAAFGSELIVNATSGDASLEALRSAGAENLAGKVLMDIANPLDFSGGMPPSLSVVNTDSLAEQIQSEFPEARVVKTLNTTNASIMVDPRAVSGGDHTVFLCGNDDEAKATVRGILESFGWTDIIDLGDITAARGSEMILPIWLSLMSALNTAAFNFKIVR